MFIDEEGLIYSSVATLVNAHGMQKVLEKLVEHNDEIITDSRSLGIEDDCMLNLKHDLEIAVKNYIDGCAGVE